MITKLWGRLRGAREPQAPRVTVVGQVFVRTHGGLTRLEAGTPVKVIERESLSNGTIRVHVADAEGRRGVCKESEIWEHVGQC